jgi:hypothetical protein
MHISLVTRKIPSELLSCMYMCIGMHPVYTCIHDAHIPKARTHTHTYIYIPTMHTIIQPHTHTYIHIYTHNAHNYTGTHTHTHAAVKKIRAASNCGQAYRTGQYFYTHTYMHVCVHTYRCKENLGSFQTRPGLQNWPVLDDSFAPWRTYKDAMEGMCMGERMRLAVSFCIF